MLGLCKGLLKLFMSQSLSFEPTPTKTCSDLTWSTENSDIGRYMGCGENLVNYQVRIQDFVMGVAVKDVLLRD